MGDTFLHIYIYIYMNVCIYYVLLGKLLYWKRSIVCSKDPGYIKRFEVDNRTNSEVWIHTNILFMYVNDCSCTKQRKTKCSKLLVLLLFIIIWCGLASVPRSYITLKDLTN